MHTPLFGRAGLRLLDQPGTREEPEGLGAIRVSRSHTGQASRRADGPRPAASPMRRAGICSVRRAVVGYGDARDLDAAGRGWRPGRMAKGWQLAESRAWRRGDESSRRCAALLERWWKQWKAWRQLRDWRKEVANVYVRKNHFPDAHRRREIAWEGDCP